MPAVQFNYISSDLAQGEDMREARQRLNPQRPKRRRTRRIVLCVLLVALLGAGSSVGQHPAHAAPRRDARSVRHLYVPAIVRPGQRTRPIAVECAMHTSSILVVNYRTGVRLHAHWNRAHDLMLYAEHVTFDGLVFRNRGSLTVFTMVVC